MRFYDHSSSVFSCDFPDFFFGKYACNQMYDLRQNFLDQYFEMLDKIHLIYLHSILNFK